MTTELDPAAIDFSQAKVTRIDGKPLVRCECCGLVHGEPLNITDEQRASMPRLEPLGDGPMEYAVGYAQPVIEDSAS